MRDDEKLLLFKVAAMIEAGLMQYDSPISGCNYRRRINSLASGVFAGWVIFKTSGGEFYRLLNAGLLKRKPYSSAYLLTDKGKKMIVRCIEDLDSIV